MVTPWAELSFVAAYVVEVREVLFAHFRIHYYLRTADDRDGNWPLMAAAADPCT